MQFLNPSYLWALLGLLVPIAIHMWSKKQGRTIKVGSVKFLKASENPRSRSFQINELLLLFLRLLIVGLLVLIISGLSWKKSSQHSPLTYIIEASLLDTPEIKSLADEWSEHFEVRLLQKEFPTYEGEPVDSNSFQAPFYWQLAKEMQYLPTDSIVVLTRSLLKGIKGKRPNISKKIKWIVKDTDGQEEVKIGGITSNEGVELISVNSDATHLKFKKEFQPLSSIENTNIKLIEKDTIAVYLFSDPDFKAEARYIKASVQALGNYLDYPIQVKSINNTEALKLADKDMLVWLSETPISGNNGKVLQFKADKFAKTLIIRGDSPDTYYLTQRLNSENSINGHLAEHVLDILDPYIEIESIAEKHDKRTIPLDALQPNYNNESTYKSNEPIESSTVYLWAILTGLLLIERLLARYRKQ